MSGYKESGMQPRVSVRKLFGLVAAGLTAAAGLLALFVYFASKLAGNELQHFDLIVGEGVRSATASWLRPAAVIATWMGSAYVEIAVLAVAAWYLYGRKKQKRETIVLSAGLLGAWLLNIWLKSIFQRARPDIRHLVQAGGYSFPSGHAMVSAYFYGMLGYLVWHHLRNKRLAAWLVPFVTALLVLAIGVSRIYLGVHYASDVSAGFAAGTAWLIACICVMEAWRHRKALL